MGGLDSQSKKKKITHSVDMTERPTEPEWVRPPDDECEELPSYHGSVPGGPSDERLVIRLVYHLPEYALVEFAIVMQVQIGTVWVDVVEIDSCHNDDVHLHYYAQSSRKRFGNAERLCDVRSIEDVQTGYELALDTVELDRQRLRERWRTR